MDQFGRVLEGKVLMPLCLLPLLLLLSTRMNLLVDDHLEDEDVDLFLSVRHSVFMAMGQYLYMMVWGG